MITLLAQVPTSMEIGGWAICLFAIAAGVKNILAIVDRTKEQPPPASTYRTIALCDAREVAQSARLQRLEVESGSINREMRDKFDRLEKSNEERAEKLHIRIDKLAAETNQKVQDLPSQIAVLLKNTGAI